MKAQPKRWSIALSLIVSLSLLSPGLASELEQQQQQLQAVQQQMQTQKQAAEQAQVKVNGIAGQLHEIQQLLDGVEAEYAEIERQLSSTQRQIDDNKQLLIIAQRNLDERTAVLNRRLRDIYVNGQIGYFDVLVGAADFTDLTTRLDLLKRILNQDATLIAQVKAERQLIRQKTGELERGRARLAELEAIAAARQDLIRQQRHEQQLVLDSAVNEKQIAEQAYRELLETSRQIEQMIRSAGSGEAMAPTGSMVWPTRAPITSPFGWRTHPIFGTQRLHTGIDIGAGYGETVVAANHGIVIYADWMGGYGKAVVIDHGGGISTLYAHNSQLLVSVGQRVSRGTPITRVGSTGYSTGPHLHFEVRENGTPVNPLGYLP